MDDWGPGSDALHTTMGYYLTLIFYCQGRIACLRTPDSDIAQPIPEVKEMTIVAPVTGPRSRE
jgi:hypothetical protein